MANVNHFVGFDITSNIDFIASFDDIGGNTDADGNVTAPTPGDISVGFTIDGPGRSVVVSGQFMFNLVLERSGEVLGLSAGQEVQIDSDGDGELDETAIQIEYIVSLVDVDVEDFNNARLTSDPVRAWAALLGTDDIVTGSGDADVLFGFGGDDLMRGRGGADELRGFAGDDTINAGGGADTVTGDSGRDLVNGQGGADVLRGGGADDTLNGGGGADVLRGDAGDDMLNGGGGRDVLRGGADNDTLKGGGGVDRLFGGTGDDRLVGGGGADLLRGDAGDDTLVGGAGPDTFFFNANAGDDVVIGFVQGFDQMRLTGVGSFDGLGIDVVNGDTVITFGATTITLDGISSGLIAEDFLF